MVELHTTLEPATRNLMLTLTFTNRAGRPVVQQRIARGATAVHLDIPLPGAHRGEVDAILTKPRPKFAARRQNVLDDP